MFFVIFKELSLKQIKPTFYKAKALTLMSFLLNYLNIEFHKNELILSKSCLFFISFVEKVEIVVEIFFSKIVEFLILLYKSPLKQQSFLNLYAVLLCLINAIISNFEAILKDKTSTISNRDI